ncbi:MAG: hypothetical protein AAF532_08240 [Planctomycetota bacterium]
MQITIPDSPELAARVEAGGYPDAEAYVRALVDRDLEVAAIMEGVADVEAGRVKSLEGLREEVLRALDERHLDEV